MRFFSSPDRLFSGTPNRLSAGPSMTAGSPPGSRDGTEPAAGIPPRPPNPLLPRPFLPRCQDGPRHAHVAEHDPGVSEETRPERGTASHRTGRLSAIPRARAPLPENRHPAARLQLPELHSPVPAGPRRAPPGTLPAAAAEDAEAAASWMPPENPASALTSPGVPIELPLPT